MSLTIGSNTYVTVEEADDYAESHYLTDAQRVAWEQMSAGDKEICLRRACSRLECLKYAGVKFSFPQILSFPRYLGENYAMIDGVLYAPETEVYPELREIPTAVKVAQIEEAMEIASPTDDTAKKEIRSGAVESYSIGHLSETFALAASGSMVSILSSSKAQNAIAPYVGGSFDVV